MRAADCVSCGIFSCKTRRWKEMKIKKINLISLDSTPSTQSISSQQCAEMHQHRETVRLNDRLAVE